MTPTIKIVKQAIERVTPTVTWVYSKWENGKVTKSRVEYTDGGYNIGFEQEVEVKPMGLNWVDVTTTRTGD